ncbi:MAG: uroporphyrinogen decarboxylase family protein [Bacillota bacterium]
MWQVSKRQYPVVLYFDFFAAVRQGVSPQRFIEDPHLKRETVIKTFFETGADAFVIGRLPGPLSYAAGGFPNRIRLPGIDLPEHSMWQFEESEATIYVEDYDYIADHGWNKFLKRLLPRFTGLKAVELEKRFEQMKEWGHKDLQAWRQAGVYLTCGAAVTAPFEVLTAGRTMFNFFEDLFIRPQKVLAALKGMLPDFIENTVEAAEQSGIPGVVITAHRSSGSLLSPGHFEIFALPFLEEMVNSFSRMGLGIMLHLDCDWSKNLSYLANFPLGMIIHTDGSTDLAAAADIFKDRFILMGDVPATLLSRGAPAEVENYCKELIAKTTPQAPLILSSGCDVPMDARMENVQAMIGAASGL